MAFWGIEVKPGKPYTHQYDDERGRLHVSQATLGNGSSKEKAVVVCSVGEKKAIYLCSLLPKKMETCPLNVEFEEYEEVIFSVEGPHSVHLSGFFYGESQDSDEDDSESDSYGAGSFEAESDSGEYSDNDSEDDEEEFTDNDIDMFPPSPVANSGVRIEEIVDDEKPANENGMSEREKKKNSRLSGSNDYDNSQQQIILKNPTSVPVMESEDEDGFPVTSPSKEKTEKDVEKGTDGQAKRKKPADVSGHTAKRKKGGSVKSGGQARDINQPVNISAPTPEEDVKKAKKKNKKVRERERKMQEAGSGSKSTIQPQVEHEQEQIAEEKTQPKEKNAKKNKKKSKQQESSAGTNIEQNIANRDVSTNKIKEKAEAKPFQARTFPNGLVIEELQMGKPDGKRASPGKKVSVHYIGKLKKNGKIFDSNIGQAPFKFRLGVGEVIKGWDVGVNGMRVGDKRRLTIPPAMGYGSRGAGAAIPPNSWLMFDVELVGAS